MDYSNGCDSFTKPLGESTLNIPRPLIGNVSYDGAGIDHCRNPGQIALTFDDGPFNYTSHLLDVLAAYGAKATFFITGNNLGKGQIDIEENGWPELIRRMHRDGHQIAAHTWTHQNLTLLNSTEMLNQVQYLEMAFRNILGFFPTYMRPPYTECQADCQKLLKKMGYHVTYQNLVTMGR
jgi:peptidoglycan/xylan/chitin deacetylase (PgdA/CDA1 family)